MAALGFLVVTDAECQHMVAFNIDAIEVVEERTTGETYIQTAQHTAVVAGTVTEVLDLIAAASRTGDES